MSLRIIEPGWGTTLQDHGRLGYEQLGVPRAGAVDREGFDLANRLVGNPVGAVAIETAGGLVVEAVQAVVVATSADGRRYTLPAGRTLTVEPLAGHRWTYLAVRGGIEATAVLGSCSHDTLADLGPPHLRAGDLLPVGFDPGTELPAELVPRRVGEPVVRIWEGPRCHWFVEGITALTRHRWTVRAEANRIGVRLSAGRFQRIAEAPERMPSEGLVEGAIQITPAGEPIVMLANHPTTGGYPVIAVVDPADVPIVAHAVPGSTLLFRPAARRLPPPQPVG